MRLKNEHMFMLLILFLESTLRFSVKTSCKLKDSIIWRQFVYFYTKNSEMDFFNLWSIRTTVRRLPSVHYMPGRSFQICNLYTSIWSINKWPSILFSKKDVVNLNVIHNFKAKKWKFCKVIPNIKWLITFKCNNCL